MKILFVSPSYKPAYIYGGPAISVSELAEALVSIGHEVTVYTTTANGREELDVSVAQPANVNGVMVYYHKRLTGDHTHISPTLWERLYKNCLHFDVVHLQSWWSLLVFGSAFICRLRRKEYIISPRGMLSAYSFSNGHNLYKSLLHQFIGRKLIRNSFLHATSSLEWKDCRLVEKTWQGFVAYNLVDLPEPVEGKPVNDGDVLQLGFLSRIDPKKGIELLFLALTDINFEYHLHVAGTGDSAYVESLKRLAIELGISARVTWHGWQSGKQKFQFFRQMDLFVLPSYNENFANSVIESLSVGCPVLISNKVGLSEYVAEKKFGWVCNTDHSSIAENLQAIHLKRNELNRIKSAAPFVISKDFDRKAMAEQYSADYKSLIFDTVK